MGKLDEAIAYYQEALRLNPNFGECYFNLGGALRDKGQYDEAIQCYQKAIQLNPNYAEAYDDLGLALHDKGQYDEAIQCYQKAIQLNPELDNVYYNLGNTLKENNRLREALNFYRRSIEINPEFPDAHWNSALTLLLSGNFKEGFEQYEWRWKRKELTSRRYDFLKPSWNGSPLEGKNIFIYAEQGIGDEIMFASCIPNVIAQGKLCIIACEKRLVPLFSRSFSDALVTAHFDPDNIYPSNLPPVDAKIAMGSLPKFFCSDLTSLLNEKRKAYLIPDIEKVSVWRDRFAKLGKGLKVGISWRGGMLPAHKVARSISLERWTSILTLQQVHYINLQYGDCGKEFKEMKENLGIIIHDWPDADPLKDLDNFAAKIDALDLVISIDNSTVHMAGALGKPVWTLLPFAPDWRWMLDREDSPWYPTMRLFRQPAPGDWESVIAKVKNELVKLLGNN